MWVKPIFWYIYIHMVIQRQFKKIIKTGWLPFTGEKIKVNIIQVTEEK